MNIRKNVKTLNKEQKNNFIEAILKLKKVPSKLHRHDNTKNRYDDYVEIYLLSFISIDRTSPSVDPNWYPGWGHNGPAFFPWHRVLLLQFERDLQKISGKDITIPYWDWTDTDPTASPFTEDFMGGDGESTATEVGGKVIDGPFAFDGPNHWTLNVNVNDPIVNRNNPAAKNFLTRGFGRIRDSNQLPCSTEVDSILKNRKYEYPPWKIIPHKSGFRAEVEYRLNNVIHRYVNGCMRTIAAPNDPVFWLHFSNIDRLWTLWQQQNKESFPYGPVGKAPGGHNLYDTLIYHAPYMSLPWDELYTPLDLLDHIKLGYAYDADPDLEPLLVSSHPKRIHLSKIPPESDVHELFNQFPLKKDVLKFSQMKLSKQIKRSKSLK